MIYDFKKLQQSLALAAKIVNNTHGSVKQVKVFCNHQKKMRPT